MIHTKKLYIAVLLLLGVVFTSSAQDSYWSANWDISMPVGSTGDYITNVNFRGFSMEGRFFVKKNITLGGFLGWNTLYDKVSDLPPREIEIDGGMGHISGTQLHYLNIVPVLATTHYYFDTKGDAKISIGTGIGGVYVEQRTDLGLKSYYSDSFAFAVQPELGVFLPMGYGGGGVNLAVRYLYGTSAGELESLSTVSFAIGFGFMN